MTLMESIIAAIPLEPKFEEGDYYKNINGDETLFCGKCDTPKGCWMEFQGQYRQLSVMCACRKRTVEAEDEQNALEGLERFRRDCLKDEHFIDMRFDKSEMSNELSLCKTYAENFKEIEKRGEGLLLYGGVGTGKTHAAACIANHLIDNRIRVAVTSFPQMLQGGFDKNELVSELKSARLVVIDDLGAERQTEYSLETVYYIVNELYKAKKPLVITTNLDYAEIRSPIAEEPRRTTYMRIYDRILERTSPIVFDGESRRGAKHRRLINGR